MPAMAHLDPAPSNHTAEGGVLIGSPTAERRLVLFEDPQCPYCRQFEEICGETVRVAVAEEHLSVEYRMRCFLGKESVRADNALALAAEVQRFDELRRQLFATQPPEGTGGFTAADLIESGRQIGVTDYAFTTGIRDRRYEPWVVERERVFQMQDPQGTPAALLDEAIVDQATLFDRRAFASLIG
jgi:hypothetical protein